MKACLFLGLASWPRRDRFYGFLVQSPAVCLAQPIGLIFMPKALRLPAQGCEALRATLGSDAEHLLPRRGCAHIICGRKLIHTYGRNPFGARITQACGLAARRSNGHLLKCRNGRLRPSGNRHSQPGEPRVACKASQEICVKPSRPSIFILCNRCRVGERRFGVR